MTVGIGSLNVKVGVDTKALNEGLKKGAVSLTSFHKRLSKINLEGAIQGNPFSQVDKYFKESRIGIASVFEAWSKNINEADVNMGKFAAKSKVNTSKLIEGWNKFRKSIEQDGAAPLAKLSRMIYSLKGAGTADLSKIVHGDFKKNNLAEFDALHIDLKKIGEVSPEAAEKVQKFYNILAQGAKLPKKELKELIGQLQSFQYAAQGSKIAKSLKVQSGLELGQSISGAKSEDAALVRRKIAVQNLIVEQKRLKTEIELGINVDKNKIALDKNRIQIQELKITKTVEEIKKARELRLEEYKRQKTIPKRTEEDRGKYKIDLALATSMSEAQKRRWDIIRGIELTEAKLNANIKVGIDREGSRVKLAKLYHEYKKMGISVSAKGINIEKELTNQVQRRAKIEKAQQKYGLFKENQRIVSEIQKGISLKSNIIALEKNHLRLKQAGVKLSKQQTDELEKAKVVMQKKDSSGGFLSKSWLAYRIKWFVQLRLAWAAWRLAMDSARGALEFEQELANISAIAQVTTEQFKSLREEALEVGTTTKFSAKEAGEAMTVMAQAGLTVVEILKSIKDTATLATATLFDFKETAKVVTTVMRAWETDNAVQIVDTLATSINKTRLTMDSLAVGFNYISGIAPQLNLDLQDTVAMLGTMANRGMSASTSATSLRAMLAALLKPTKRFQEQLKRVNLTMDDVNPQFRSVTDILVTMKQAGWGAAESFRAFRRRAASGISILVRNADSLKDLSENMYEVGRSAQMSEEQLGPVLSQWKLFKDALIKISSDILIRITPALVNLISLVKGLSIEVGYILTPFAALLGLITKGLSLLGKSIFGKNIIDFEVGQKAIKELNNQVKSTSKNITSLITKFRKLRDGYVDIQSTIQHGKERGGKLESEMYERVLSIAKKVNLLNEEELINFSDVNTNLDKRVELEKLINKKYKERKNDMAVEYSLLDNILKTQRSLVAVSVGEEMKVILKEWDTAINKIKETAKDSNTYSNIRRLPIEAVKNINTQTMKDIEDKFKKTIQNMSADSVKALIDPKSNIYDKNIERIYRGIVLANKEQVSLAEALNMPIEKLRIATDRQLKVFKEVVGDTPENEPTPEELEMDKLEKKYDEDKLKIEEEIEDILSSRSKVEQQELNIQRKIGELIKKYESVVGSTVELRKLENEHLKAISKIQAEITQEKSDELDIQLSLQSETNTFEKQRLIQREKTNKSLTSIMKNNPDDLELMTKTLELGELELKEIDRKEDKYKLEIKLKSELIEIAKQQAKLEMGSSSINKVKLLELEKKSLQLKVKMREELLKSTILDVDRQRIYEEISELTMNIGKNQEKIRRETELWYGILKNIEDKSKTFKETIQEMANKAYEMAESGLANIGFQITTGFQEQQQAVAELEQEYEQLEEQLQEALTNQDAEAIAEINNEMRELQNEIEKTEDPIRNLGEAFRSFFKGVIDELNKLVMKWLAAQALMGILNVVGGLFSGGNSGTMIDGVDVGIPGIATGGVIPNIKSFRKFSSGGLTNGASLAMLGDNASGKELIIPSENIQKNNVSGYVRDSETPINIINVTTNEDIAKAMASASGERVVLNLVARDLGSKGITYKSLTV